MPTGPALPAQHGLDAASFDVLATLRRSAPPHRLTPAELTRSSMVTSGAITQRLDRLEARGLVTRLPNETDGRGVRVALTPEGRTLIDRVLPDHVATGDHLLDALTPARRETPADGLRTLLEALGDTPATPPVTPPAAPRADAGPPRVNAPGHPG